MMSKHTHSRSQTAPPPPPPAEAKEEVEAADDRQSRASEFYGFVAWTSTYLLLVLYLLWAVSPDDWIQSTGVTWYPNREWALLVPSWTIIAVIVTYISYSALALRATPAFNDMRSITDSLVALPSQNDAAGSPYYISAYGGSIPELYDIPIGVVNSVLYRDVLERKSSKGVN